MSSSKKLIAIMVLIATCIPYSSFAALTVGQAITSLQATDPSLPTGVSNPKGDIGFILANIFGTSGSSLGKIQSQYLDVAGLNIWTASGSNAYLTNTTGNVGIGTTSPSKLLHLATPTGTNAELDIQTGTKQKWGMYHDESTEQLRFWNGSDRVTFSSGGNVGIGTTQPLNPLHIVSGTANTTGDSLTLATAQITGPNVAMSGVVSNATFLVATNNTPAIDVGGSIGFAGRYTGTSQFTAAQIKGAKEDGIAGNFGGYLAFGTRANGVPITEKMRIAGNGNVGIGTTNPLRKFSISGGGIAFQDAGGANRSINWGDESTGIFPVLMSGYSSTGNGYMVFSTNTFGNNGVERMRIDSAGNVGIGTSTPGAKLEVTGNIIADTPTAPNHVATKAYVDAAAGSMKVYMNNGTTLLGTLVGIGDGDAILFAQSDGTIVTIPINHRSTTANTFYTSSNCTGTAYADSGAGIYKGDWYASLDGNAYSYSNSSGVWSGRSSSWNGTSCTAGSWSGYFVAVSGGTKKICGPGDCKIKP